MWLEDVMIAFHFIITFQNSSTDNFLYFSTLPPKIHVDYVHFSLFLKTSCVRFRQYINNKMRMYMYMIK